MSIIYQAETGQFYLHTDCSTYIIELLDGRIPMHAYWGASLDTMPPMVTWDSVRARCMLGLDTGVEGEFACSGTLPLEYPVFGGDLREPAFHARYADGSRLTCLEYVSHTIAAGKPALAGLPATYGTAEQVDTLELKLRDAATGLEVYLLYSVFPARDAIARSVRVVNTGKDTVELLKVNSASVDFYDGTLDMLHLQGYWTRERHMERQPVTHTAQMIDAKGGGSSHSHNPFFALMEPAATETAGEVFGFNLVYSGNFAAGAAKDSHEMTRAFIGINDFDFCWQLDSGETFQAPEAVLVYSNRGLGEMSRQYHRLYRDNLCRGEYQYADRPVLVNNWEATYFDFNEEKLLAIAEKAKALDIDMLVLDDGWFGKRNNDHCSLGDWVVNTDKLPAGLKGLGEKLNAMGLQFGLWFEPEMVSPDSDLYRAHPDWCIHVAGRRRSPSRHQLVLDLSRQDVCDYIVESLSTVLADAPIRYVKWDMNRHFSEIGSACLEPRRQAELPHRYMLGLYQVLETLTSRFPHVLFEGCSSGGGRFDPGMLYYSPQIWCSDDSDAVERLYIQYGTSVVYPPVTMGAHVSAVPNHQVGRTTPFRMRGDVAMSGQFGYELDLSVQSEEDLALAKEQVAFYKAHRHTVQQGDMYRLVSPFENAFAAWEYVSPDRNEVLLCTFVIKGCPCVMPRRVKMQGLDAAATYVEEKTGREYSGAFLMQVGVARDYGKDYLSEITVFCKK